MMTSNKCQSIARSLSLSLSLFLSFKTSFADEKFPPLEVGKNPPTSISNLVSEGKNVAEVNLCACILAFLTDFTVGCCPSPPPLFVCVFAAVTQSLCPSSRSGSLPGQ